MPIRRQATHSMAAEYRLVLRDAAGAKTADVSDMLALSYRKRLNEPGLCVIDLAGDHAAVALLTWRAQVEIWRRNVELGLAWYCDFRGLMMDDGRAQGHPDRFTAQCPGQMTMLSWRTVAWSAGTASRSQFTAAKPETIAKALVTYNATASATVAAGRKREGAISGATITVEADSAAGTSIDIACAYDGLLTSIQKIAAISGHDFDLVKTAAATWEFRWYASGRGVDRSSTLSFSTQLGNMRDARYRYDRKNGKTVAIVGGQSVGASRDVVVRTGADYAADADIEMFINASGQTSTTAGYQAEGDRALDGARAKPEFKFGVAQMPGCYYGVHYCTSGDLGDRVKWRYRDLTGTARIRGVSVNYAGRKESISVEALNV